MKDKKVATLFIIVLVLGIPLFSCNSKNNATLDNTENNTKMPVIETTNQGVEFEKKLMNDSLNIPLRLELASYYYENKDLDKAIYHSQIVFQIDSKNLQALISLGNLYYDTQQNDNAIAFYKKSLKIDNSNINVRCDMATCYLNLNKMDEALSILLENIKMNSNHAQSHHNLAVVYQKLGKTKEAEMELSIFNQLKNN